MERMQKSEIIAFLQCSNIDDVASTVKFTKWKAKLLKMIKEISEIQPRSSTTALSCVQHAKTKQHTSNIGGSRVSASPPIKSTTSVDFPMFTSIPTFQDLIGNTPMIDLSALLPPVVASRGVRVLAKCEFMNPGLSVKDRIMQHIFNKAEARGDLKPGSVVVAASSGNTGAATAMLAAMRGYHAIITTSPKCSKEKMAAIKAYGAELLISNPGLTASDSGHYMNHANKIVNTENNKIRENKTKNKTFWFNVSQYDNPNNPEAHATTLGPEIWKQTCAANIPVTHFVAAGSTGGTISGTSSFLKQKDPSILTTLADPVGSIFTEHFMKLKKQKYSSDSSKNDSNTDVKRQKFLVEGVGKTVIPGCINFDVIDDVLPIDDSEAFKMCHKLSSEMGILVGGSSGLNVAAALRIANRQEGPATIVTILCDSGVKYLSKIYDDTWLRENNLPSL